jgi:hypothetical protein
VSSLPLQLNLVSPDRIIIDPDSNNHRYREFNVWPCKNLLGVDGKSVLDGYYIRMKADNRWLLDEPEVDWYKARIFSDSQILIRAPAFDYDDINSRDFVMNKYSRTGNVVKQQVDDNIIFAMDAMNNFLCHNPEAKEAQKWEYFILEFPSDIKLSVEEIYADCGKDQELDPDPIEVTSFHMGREGTVNTQSYVGWKVVKQIEKAYKIGKSDDAKKPSKLASKLGFSSPGASGPSAVQAFQQQLQQAQQSSFAGSSFAGPNAVPQQQAQQAQQHAQQVAAALAQARQAGAALAQQHAAANRANASSSASVVPNQTVSGDTRMHNAGQ